MSEFNLLLEVEKHVKMMGEWYDEEMDTRLKDLNPEAHSVTPRIAREFLLRILQLYPPQLWQHPDGRMEFNSIWLIELRDNERIKDGKKLFNQLSRGIS